MLISKRLKTGKGFEIPYDKCGSCGREWGVCSLAKCPIDGRLMCRACCNRTMCIQRLKGASGGLTSYCREKLGVAE